MEELVEALNRLLEGTGSQGLLQRALAQLEALPAARQVALLEVALEIARHAPKVAVEWLLSAPATTPVLSPEALGPWGRFVGRVASRSSVAAIKLLRQAPEALSGFGQRLTEGLDLVALVADGSPEAAVTAFIQFPAVLDACGEPEERRGWAKAGRDLGARDYGIAVEYFRASPACFPHLPPSERRAWTDLGLLLAQERYVAAIEYFRLSPEVFQAAGRHLVPAVLHLGTALSAGSPQAPLEWFRLAPTLLTALPDRRVTLRLIELAERLAGVAPPAAVAFLREIQEVPAIVRDLDFWAAGFEDWFAAGLALARRRPGEAAAYFRLSSKSSREALAHVRRGRALSEVARTLELFAQGLAGRQIRVRSTEDLPRLATSGADETGAPVMTATTDGRVIYLPPRIERFPDAEANFRLYTVLTAHEAGHLEYGTFDATREDLEVALVPLRSRHGEQIPLSDPTRLLEDHFPDPGLARALWALVEDTRIEAHLKDDYPGLRAALDILAQESLSHRAELTGLPAAEALLEAVIQLSLAGQLKGQLPDALTTPVLLISAIVGSVQQPRATVRDSLTAMVALYLLLEGVRREASVDLLRLAPSVESAAHRGELRPELVARQVQAVHGAVQAARDALDSPDAPSSQMIETAVETVLADDPLAWADSDLASMAIQKLAPEAGRGVPGSWSYDEWDAVAGDYRPGWCTVHERMPVEGSPEVVEQILVRYRGLIVRLRRYFQAMRPESLRRLKRQDEGEEIDLDAVVEFVVEKRAGHTPSGRVYTSRDKRERNVAVAFLVDLSGSTARQLTAGQDPPQRVLDVEREGLVLLVEALEAIGDRYALYGFSGHGHEQVDVFVLKAFDEAYGPGVRQRLGGLEPLGQNRDGSAIRHVTRRLLEQPARVRLLILLSDGRPLDAEYRDRYALEDTRMALREARSRGIHPYCITVDREASAYIRQMYGEVAYTIVDHVEALPERLPRLYSRLTA